SPRWSSTLVYEPASRRDDVRREGLYRRRSCARLRGEPFPLRDGSGSGRSPCDTQHYVAVFEMSKESWLVGGIIPGLKRQPLKKLSTDENELLKLLERWRTDAGKAGYKINRIAVAFETGRDGFWLARWLRAHAIEAHVIHAASVAVSREHRRPKTD